MGSIHLFRDLPEIIVLTAGDFVFRRGEPGDRMYLVIEGEIELVVGKQVVETARPGAFIGELALIDESPRSASARARADARVFPIDEHRFQSLVQETPSFALDLMRTLASRLRRTTASIARDAPKKAAKKSALKSKRPAPKRAKTRRAR